MYVHHAAIDLEVATKAREWNEQKAKLEKELKSAQYSESVFCGSCGLLKAAKLLTEKDNCFNGKLVDKEVDVEILQLAGYFSDAKDKGCLDDVIKAATHQAKDEKTAVRNHRKMPRRLLVKRLRRKMSESQRVSSIRPVNPIKWPHKVSSIGPVDQIKWPHRVSRKVDPYNLLSGLISHGVVGVASPVQLKPWTKPVLVHVGTT
ncbi:hypothetical protein TIFTF001_016677 [Ficus carica]|uniref:Uncharacterized protein n=1 Tax=Ficus carica TaxID=3494 RepID=A0AA88A3K9_FICCA|nr:hypothetical protein TIFTF001_016677 [Ficus carica]